MTSAGTAPDARATFTFAGNPTTVAGKLAQLHDPDGVRMAADHWVAKSMGSTPWVKKISDTVYACPWGMHEWLIMRTVDIGDTLLPLLSPAPRSLHALTNLKTHPPAT